MAKTTIAEKEKKTKPAVKTAAKSASPKSAAKTSENKKTAAVKTAKKTVSEEKVKTPLYITEIYGPMYEDAEISQNLDDNRLWTLATLGYNNKLANEVCVEVNYQNKVLQMGATYGLQIEKVAEKIGSYGKFDILDVSKVQIDRLKNKFIYSYPEIKFLHQDAALPVAEKYDVVICYMLLHEVPNVTKTKIINNALNSVRVGGKVVFVDYHNPSKWNPLRYFIRMFNRLYQPFAETLWKTEIKSFADNPANFNWRKVTFFGRIYQKVVAVRKR